MINNIENHSKLYRLKKIYDMLDSLTKQGKPDRLNSAISSPQKLKIPLHRRIKIKKLNVIDKRGEKSNEKLNNNYILDIVNRKPFNRRVILKRNFDTKDSNSNILSVPNKSKKNAKIQTERFNKPIIYHNSFVQKDNKYNNICRSIMDYRIKYKHKKKRNINGPDENKSISPIFKTAKNINFPNIYSYREKDKEKERKIQDYLDLSNKKQTAKRNINMKRYYCILNNLRIKFHGNILLTRKTKESEVMYDSKNKMVLKNLRRNLKGNTSISMDRSHKYRNISQYDLICNFSNQIIRESLSEKHMQNLFCNLKK